ncbi:MAG TPA: CDP-alcohol phosphatidyltransferase family protein [Phototrophicaceae bacterium]|nr:CDP-alcohol phosphatidyltransferase family protein [Phototrophicaceae bacterium]
MRGRAFAEGRRAGGVAGRGRDAWATWPNAVTLARLLLTVPVCRYLLSLDDGGAARAPALVVAAAVLWAGSDWLDGLLARWLGQVSRLGEVLDPVADRLGILAVAASLATVGELPWAVPGVVVVTDAAVLVLAGPAARRGRVSVSVLGKVRTAVLLTGFCVLLAGVLLEHPAAHAGRVLLGVGTALHLAAGVGYVRRARAQVPKPPVRAQPRR